MASIGTAGVPSVGLLTLAMVLKQVGLPVEGIALIIGVDRLLDMTRTASMLLGIVWSLAFAIVWNKPFNPSVMHVNADVLRLYLR